MLEVEKVGMVEGGGFPFAACAQASGQTPRVITDSAENTTAEVFQFMASSHVRDF
jgi:hypothetical protein